MTNGTTSWIRRHFPWIMAGAGVGMIALATVGLRVLFADLAWFGISIAAHQAAIGALVMGLIAVGILVSLLGAILLLARTGSGTATWLIGSGRPARIRGADGGRPPPESDLRRNARRRDIHASGHPPDLRPGRAGQPLAETAGLLMQHGAAKRRRGSYASPSP